MKVYVATVRENSWETDDLLLGVYSTEEKAKASILEFLNHVGEDVEILEIYNLRGNARNYLWDVTSYEVDE